MANQPDPHKTPQRPTAYRTEGLPQATPNPQPQENGGPPPDRHPGDAPTPTQQMVASKATQATRRDARGRMITVKRLTLLDFYRLTKLLGEHSATPTTMDLASVAASVVEIDGEVVFFPTGERELEYLMQRLDFDGLTAVSEALKSLTPGPEESTLDIAKN